MESLANMPFMPPMGHRWRHHSRRSKNLRHHTHRCCVKKSPRLCTTADLRLCSYAAVSLDKLLLGGLILNALSYGPCGAALKCMSNQSGCCTDAILTHVHSFLARVLDVLAIA